MTALFETFTPPGEMERPEAERRSYEIKPLAKMDFMRFMASGKKEGDAAIELELNTVPKGLTGWSNINDAEGNPVPFQAEREHIFDAIPVVHLRLIFQRIITISVLADDQQKN
ncbi:hypothetical protein L2750_14480 [Shewanella submarina]|uniref:Uncharacterized protein n=1 Tax=Shewanella submarina TaxID=2016376 RepID=A0ABV7GCA1_9GAMM|nr:hypothetical protein [Shewanella submarina]MCL1038337.1 hypothetical protein [Shewanella submarina]